MKVLISLDVNKEIFQFYCKLGCLEVFLWTKRLALYHHI